MAEANSSTPSSADALDNYDRVTLLAERTRALLAAVGNAVDEDGLQSRDISILVSIAEENHQRMIDAVRALFTSNSALQA